jgi:hypothetical protein
MRGPKAKAALLAVLGVLVAVVPFAGQFIPAASARTRIAAADPAFEQVWSRTDRPVEERRAARSWMWGPDAFYSGYEPYAEGPGGQHLVSYFDKSRMEINNPAGDRNSRWFVTNGLLVVDMIAGRIQMGDHMFAPTLPADIPVAGDANSPNAPTYAALATVASLKGDNRAPNRTGQNVREGLGRRGNIGVVDNLAGFATYAVYEPTLGHNIPDVFWSFLNQKGMVYNNGRYVNDTVVDWLFAMGYPITEPYWININVNGQERWVLMQAFQRRILTYSPHNPEGWKVEMANVGRAYYDWRYKGRPLPPAPTPTSTARPAAQAAITVEPAQGDATTPLTVSGRNFPAHSAVLISVEKPSANYFRGITTAAARADGTFSTRITLPADAAVLGEVNIVASANAGAVRATHPYRLNYNPTIAAGPLEVVTNGVVRVRGEGFPARIAVNLGFYFTTGEMQWVIRTETNASGTFDANLPVGNRPVGAQFTVVATADGGLKATTDYRLTVIAQPGLQVTPDRGPAGVYVTLRGYSWPPNRPLSIGTRAVGSSTEAWLPNLITTDGAGNFSVAVWLDPQYSTRSEVRLMASESKSTIRLEVPYYITGQPTATPRPSNATVAISPNVLAIGQVATVSGSRWPGGALVSIGVGRTGVDEWIAQAQADAAGNFSVNLALGPRWQNAGQLTLTAVAANGPTATTPVWVVASGGRIVPAGLPLTVNSYRADRGPIVYWVKGEGWQPGSVVNLSVISADGTVNVQVGSATVRNNGTFNITFNAGAPWWGRTDLGVQAIAVGGHQYSVRYLPITDMVKTVPRSNTFTARGTNWPANAEIILTLNIEGQDPRVLGRTVTDASGSFVMNVDLPDIPDDNQDDIQIRAKDQPYTAVFDF